MNLTSVFKAGVVQDPWRTPRFSFTNSQQYVKALAKHVAVESIKDVMVIIGPKDAGKSTGIVEMTRYWRELGHIVVDLNLKGFSHSVSGKSAMVVISE